MKLRYRPPVVAIAIVGLSLTLAGCGSPSIPTVPSIQAPVPVVPPPAPPAQPGDYTLSGVVFEMTPGGQVPVEGVLVYCDSCGSPFGHTWVTTDVEGFYSLSWAANGNHALIVWKEGFDVKDPRTTYADGSGVRDATVNGNTRFDIQLLRR